MWILMNTPSPKTPLRAASTLAAHRFPISALLALIAPLFLQEEGVATARINLSLMAKQCRRLMALAAAGVMGKGECIKGKDKGKVVKGRSGGW